jgi:hypothetical protein
MRNDAEIFVTRMSTGIAHVREAWWITRCDYLADMRAEFGGDEGFVNGPERSGRYVVSLAPGEMPIRTERV